MYKVIKKTPPVLDKYAEKLIEEKVVTKEEVKVISYILYLQFSQC